MIIQKGEDVDKLVTILIMFVSFWALFFVYIMYVKQECSKQYTLQDINLRKIDEKGWELFYCCSFYPWQKGKQDFIRLNYCIDSIIEDKQWGVEYGIHEVRGPYWRKTGDIFEKEFEFKVTRIQYEVEFDIENIPVKLYMGNRFRFDIGDYKEEIIFLYNYIEQREYQEKKTLKQLLERLFYMRGTNLMRYSDIVKIKEKLDELTEEDNELEKICTYKFLRGIVAHYNEYKIQGTTIINNSGQINMAREHGEINATQNINCLMDLRSNFARRLDYVIEIMNQKRRTYEEPITVGYICELMGEESENNIRQYYIERKEPIKKYADEVADIIGVNKKWLFKGTEVAIFDADEKNSELQDILDGIDDAEAMYIAIKDEGIGNYFLIIVKYNDVKYICYKKKNIFFLSDGCSRRGELIKVYDFLEKLSKSSNKKGKAIYPPVAYFPTDKEWDELQQGILYPAAIRDVKEYKAYLFDDFLDVDNKYRTEEQYRMWYGEEFVKCQKYIRNILVYENENR